MASKGEFEKEVNDRANIPTIRQHVMHDFFQRRKDTANGILLEGITEHQVKHTEAASQPHVKCTRQRRGRPRLRDGSSHLEHSYSLENMANNIEALPSPCSSPPASPRPPRQVEETTTGYLTSIKASLIAIGRVLYPTQGPGPAPEA